MANFFQKGLIAMGLAGALTGAPAEAKTAEEKENKVENIATPKTADEVNTQQFRVLYKTYELRANEMIPGILDSHTIPRNACSAAQTEKYYHNAHFDPTFNAAIVNQYTMSDENAFKRGKETISNANSLPKDLSAALAQFNAALSDSRLIEPIKKDGKTIKNYDGIKPQTLSEVQSVLSQKGILKPKDEERLHHIASETGLLSAINIQNTIAALNKKNASKAHVGHEFGHAKVHQTIKQMQNEGKFLEDLTPQDLLLFHMADEMAQYMHYDKAGMSPDEAMASFRAEKENNYLTYYEPKVASNTMSSATYKQWARQHMDVVQDNNLGKIADSRAFDENSQKRLDEILEKIFDADELPAVKEELNHCQSTHSYKYLKAQYGSFVSASKAENIEYAKDMAMSPEYLLKLLEKREKADQAYLFEHGFFNGLVDMTDAYNDVINSQRPSVEYELAHARELISKGKEEQTIAQTQEPASKTFVLSDETIRQLNQIQKSRS